MYLDYIYLTIITNQFFQVGIFLFSVNDQTTNQKSSASELKCWFLIGALSCTKPRPLQRNKNTPKERRSDWSCEEMWGCDPLVVLGSVFVTFSQLLWGSSVNGFVSFSGDLKLLLPVGMIVGAPVSHVGAQLCRFLHVLAWRVDVRCLGL